MVRSLCLSTEEAFGQGRSLPFINPSSLETLRALVKEIQSSGETDPEMWKDCEVRPPRYRKHLSLYVSLPGNCKSAYGVGSLALSLDLATCNLS